MTFTDPITDPGNTLVTDEIHSEGFVSGSAGWAIRRDGTAEFQSIDVRSVKSRLAKAFKPSSATQTGLARNTYQTVDWTGTEIDSDSDFNLSSNWYVLNRTGYYRVSYTTSGISFTGTPQAYRSAIHNIDDGNFWGFDTRVFTIAQTMTGGGQDVLKVVTPGERIEIVVYYASATAGATFTLGGAGIINTWTVEFMRDL